MNKRICDLSDIESLYFFQNSKETEMQEPKGTTISFIFCDQFIEDRVKVETNENTPVTRQCFISNQDTSQKIKGTNQGKWIEGFLDTTGKWYLNKEEVKLRITEEESQTHKVRPKPEDNWKGYCPMPEGWRTNSPYTTEELPKTKVCFCDGKSCSECWAKNPCNPVNFPCVVDEAKEALHSLYQKSKKCDECAREAKKLCNCGYFQATSIFKPQVSKLENSYYQILTECAKEFKAKNELYGDSVFQVRESSLVDKLYAKAKRVITLSKDGVDNKGKVGESIAEDLRAIINYTLIILVLIQNSDSDKCLEYNNMVQKCIEVAEMKDADYGSAWKEYRVETLLDEVFVKVYRLQSLIASKPKGYEDNYFDLINYAIFSLIKLK